MLSKYWLSTPHTLSSYHSRGGTRGILDMTFIVGRKMKKKRRKQALYYCTVSYPHWYTTHSHSLAPEGTLIGMALWLGKMEDEEREKEKRRKFVYGSQPKLWKQCEWMAEEEEEGGGGGVIVALLLFLGRLWMPWENRRERGQSIHYSATKSHALSMVYVGTEIGTVQ